MRPRISIRACVRPSVGPSFRPSVRPWVMLLFCRSDLCRVYGLVYSQNPFKGFIGLDFLRFIGKYQKIITVGGTESRREGGTDRRTDTVVVVVSPGIDDA